MMHFRENALNCQDAKSDLGARKCVTNGPKQIVDSTAVREKRPRTLPSVQFAPAGCHKRQHAIETEAVDRLRHPGMLDLPRNARSNRAHPA